MAAHGSLSLVSGALYRYEGSHARVLLLANASLTPRRIVLSLLMGDARRLAAVQENLAKCYTIV